MEVPLLDEIPHTIEDWATLAKVQDLFRCAEEQTEWVFRGIPGIGRKPTQLRTTLEEVASEFAIIGDDIADLEVKLILEFMRRYHLYGVEPSPRRGDTLEWLAVMRHHGAPSRLLDFTFSFLVAAYFALERKPLGIPVVWAINKTWMTRRAAEMMQALGEPIISQAKKLVELRDGEAFRNLFLKLQPRLALVRSVNPFRLNQRLTIQQGLFLCPGDVSKTFSQNLSAMAGHGENTLRISIAPGARTALLAGLHRANLNRATLFPGLDGFAQSLWTRAPSLTRLRTMEGKSRSLLNLGIDALGDC